MNLDRIIRNFKGVSSVETERIAPKSPEEFLKWVDFKTLNEIFTEVQTRSGITQPRIIEKKTISITKGKTDSRFRHEAHHDPLTGRTNMSLPSFDRKGISTKLTFDYLHTLIHEATHNISFTKVDKSKERGREYVDRIQSGLGARQNFYGDPDRNFENTGESVTEAVTEKIALQVFSEYIQRKGLTDAFNKSEAALDILKSYPHERVVLEFVISTLASSLEIDSDTVWLAIVRQYISGESDLDSFTALIAEATNNPKIQKLLKENGVGERTLDSLTNDDFLKKGIREQILLATTLEHSKNALKLR